MRAYKCCEQGDRVTARSTHRFEWLKGIVFFTLEEAHGKTRSQTYTQTPFTLVLQIARMEKMRLQCSSIRLKDEVSSNNLLCELRPRFLFFSRFNPTCMQGPGTKKKNALVLSVSLDTSSCRRKKNTLNTRWSGNSFARTQLTIT